MFDEERPIAKIGRFVLVAGLTTVLLTAKDFYCHNEAAIKELAKDIFSDNNDGNNKNDLFSGTILQSTSVITFEDGHKDIVKTIGNCSDSQYKHYMSVLTGDYIKDISCNENDKKIMVYHSRSIVNEESIVNYLTSDEISKALDGKLSNDELANIIVRIVGPQEEVKENNK